MNAAANNQFLTHTYSQSPQSDKAIIGIHGWTGDEHAFEPLARSIKTSNVKWFFPRAPYNADIGVGYSWFSGSEEEGWQVEKTMQGMDGLFKTIQDEGFELQNIYLVGFSQGACLAMEYALRLPYPIGGIVPIAGFIKWINKLESEATDASKQTPALLLHGEKDEIIFSKASIKAYEFLKKRGNPVYLDLYDAPHEIPLKRSPIIRNFISDSFNFIESKVL